MAILKREREPEPVTALTKPEPQIVKATPIEKAEASSQIPFLAQPIPVPESREKFRLALWQRVQEYHMRSGWQSDLGGPRATKMQKLLEAFYIEVFCEDVPRITALKRWDYNIRMRGTLRQKDHVDWLRVVCINEWSRLHPGYERKSIVFEPVPRDQMMRAFRFDATLSDFHPEKYGICQLVTYWKEHFIDVGLDIFCIIDSPKNIYPLGSGKSTLMVEVLAAMAKVLDCEFDLRMDVAYETDSPRVDRFMKDHRQHIVRGIDETKNIWGRRSPMANAEDMERLTLTRKDSQVWIGIVSNIFRLDKDIYEERATHLLRIPEWGTDMIERGWGQAILYQKGADNEEKDVWGNSDSSPEGLMKVRWAKLPTPLDEHGVRRPPETPDEVPKWVYDECLGYTKAHADEIQTKKRSPLDYLVMEKDPSWLKDMIDRWSVTETHWVPPIPIPGMKHNGGPLVKVEEKEAPDT